jgi:Tfp pilus assembly protein PilN
MIRINLLPGAARKRAAGVRFDPRALWASATGNIDRYVISAAAGVVVALAAIALMFFTQRGTAQELAERERRAVQDSSRFAAVLYDRAQAEGHRDAVLRQLAIIQSIDDRRFVWPHLLEEISLALPPYTWLTSITQTSTPPNPAVPDSALIALRAREDTTKPAGRARVQRARREAAVNAARAPTRFRIVGNTVDIQALTRFMRDLEASAFIQNVQLARSDLVVVDQKEVTEFQLDAESERPDESIIEVVPLTVEGR